MYGQMVYKSYANKDLKIIQTYTSKTRPNEFGSMTARKDDILP